MGRGGQNIKRDEPERRCIVTGEVGYKYGLIRFVLSPDGVVTPDIAGRLPGRGFYVTCVRSIVEKAITKGIFSRGAKAPAKIPEGLADLIDSLLVKKVIDTLSIAKKSGRILIGFDNTKSALLAEKAKYLIQASDGSKDQKAKLRPPEGKNRLISVLNGAEMGLAFGREHVIHAALTAGGATDQVVAHAARLSMYREEASDISQAGTSSRKNSAKKR